MKRNENLKKWKERNKIKEEKIKGKKRKEKERKIKS